MTFYIIIYTLLFNINYDIRIESRLSEFTRYFLDSDYFVYYNFVDRYYHIQNSTKNENYEFRFEPGNGEFESDFYGEYIVSDGIIYHYDFPKMKVITYNLSTKELNENALSHAFDYMYPFENESLKKVGLFSRTAVHEGILNKQELTDIDVNVQSNNYLELKEFNMFLGFNDIFINKNKTKFFVNKYYPIIIKYENTIEIIPVDKKFKKDEIKKDPNKSQKPPDISTFRNSSSYIHDDKIYLTYNGIYKGKSYKTNELFIFDTMTETINQVKINHYVTAFIKNDLGKVLIVDSTNTIQELTL
jgi:hypothetical protein